MSGKLWYKISLYFQCEKVIGIVYNNSEIVVWFLEVKPCMLISYIRYLYKYKSKCEKLIRSRKNVRTKFSQENSFEQIQKYSKMTILIRDKFWNLVCENRVLASKRAPFCFWRVFRSVALRKKFDTDCDPLSRRNLAFSLQIALILTDFERSWTNFPRF